MALLETLLIVLVLAVLLVGGSWAFRRHGFVGLSAVVVVMVALLLLLFF